MNTRKQQRIKEVIAYAITGPFMLIGGLAYIATVGCKAGWAWAEHLLERYL